MVASRQRDFPVSQCLRSENRFRNLARRRSVVAGLISSCAHRRLEPFQNRAQVVGKIGSGGVCDVTGKAVDRKTQLW
jgi:hypothetical protein